MNFDNYKDGDAIFIDYVYDYCRYVIIYQILVEVTS